ncbi:MAG: serine hydrolase [Cyclobacteriaceae bacterium]
MPSLKLDYQQLIVGLLFSFMLSACQADKEVETNKYEVFLSQAHDRGQFNGNALILEDGEIVFQGSFGIGNIATLDSLQLNSVFRLGSVSKQFTAMGIMKLKERGQLSYDQDVQDFIPELPYEGVTLRHLLNHVSGLPDYMDMMDTYWKPELEIDDPNRFVSGNIDLIEMFAKVKPPIHFEPGEQWEYSNTGYVLLAEVVSRVSGMSFSQFLKEQIFDPAQMTSTSVYNYVPGNDPQMPLRVYGYATELNGIDRVATDIHYLNPVAGDGGIYSTLSDLLKWDRMLYTEDLIAQDLLEEAFTPAILNNGDTTSYGFGWAIDKSLSGKKVVDHSGGWVGFTTYIYREIEENNCIILLTNNSTRYFGAIIDPLKNILHDQPYEIPTLSIGEVIGKVVLNDGVDVALDEYKKLKSEMPDGYNFSESQLNLLGYQLIQMDRMDDAMKILRLNQEEFPQSANTYDSYGDALLASGDSTNALMNFKEALAMDSTFASAKEKIMRIEKAMTAKK